MMKGGMGRKLICLAMSVIFMMAAADHQGNATEVLKDTKKNTVATPEKEVVEAEKFQSSYPEESSSSSTSTRWMVIGGAVALGLGAIAVAGGGGGGGGGGDDAPVCEEAILGPNMNGDTWQGVLKLASNGTQPVAATIYQCGREISITTTSTLRYGRLFIGRISSGGSMNVTDQTTFQAWTTLSGPARANYIKIYDYVNKLQDLDVLELRR